MFDLGSLNAEQRAAVEADFKNCLVLAGAGSGKTRVLTYRIAYLLDQKYVKPGEVLALTFTNKAAREMTERVRLLLHLDSLSSNAGFFGTFHRLGVMLLRGFGEKVGVEPNFSIVDQDDRQKLIKEVATGLGLEDEVEPKSVSHIVHSMKNRLLSVNQATEYLPGRFAGGYVEVIKGYEKVLRKNNLVDLDDLVFLPVRLLAEFSDVRLECQKRFKAVFVDEFQDTNPVQYQFLKFLCPPSVLFAVGDDAQSIYGFRGSDVRNIFQFEKDFPGSSMFLLEQNYRSTGSILEVADSVIAHSSSQVRKKLWTEEGLGEKVLVKELPDENMEAVFITNSIVELASGIQDTQAEDNIELEEDTRPFSILDYLLKNQSRKQNKVFGIKKWFGQTGKLGSFAILYRTHAQSRALESAMVAAGLPYRIYGGLRFYERKEIKDALAYLRVFVNPKDTTAWARVLAVPPKGLGQKALGVLASLLESSTPGKTGLAPEFWEELLKKVKHEPSGRTGTALEKLLEKFKKLSQMEDAHLGDWVHKMYNLTDLLSFYSNDKDTGEERRENLMELLSHAKSYEGLNWKEALARLLEEAALLGEVDELEDSTQAVTLMTLHASKGLEFDRVFFVGFEEGLIPHSRSFTSPEELDEEVRLAYVGITRARKRLVLTFSRFRGLYGSRQQQLPSRFLQSLPEQVTTWAGRRPKSLNDENLSDKGFVYEPFDE